MPRAKRTLEDADANAAAPATKSAKGTKKQPSKEKENLPENDQAQAHSNEPEPTTSEDPFEYITFCRPYYDYQRENDLKIKEGADDALLGENEVWKHYNEKTKCGEDGCMCNKPLKENPDWTWFTTRKAWDMRADLQDGADLRNPDNFDMYVYNDFAGYGQQELIENTLVAFNTEYVKKNPSLNELWAIIESLDIDDSQGMFETLNLIGCAVLSMLNRLDLAGKLKPDSEFKDIALVISVFLIFVENFEGNLPDFEVDEFWHRHLALYAKRNDIALTGVAGIGKKARKLVEEIGEDTPFITGKPKLDQWKWKNNFKNMGPPLGGEAFNILKWTSKKRAMYNFDNKDPVPKSVRDKVARGEKMMPEAV
ncbi:MAG: hypothetical protein Q9165_004344 [Trypethelium subeluteriae]